MVAQVGLEEDDEESMDWWTKYHASVDLMIKVRAAHLQWWPGLGVLPVCRRGWPTGRRVWRSSPPPPRSSPRRTDRSARLASTIGIL